jgi:hypothetical protein
MQWKVLLNNTRNTYFNDNDKLLRNNEQYVFYPHYKNTCAGLLVRTERYTSYIRLKGLLLKPFLYEP